MQPLPDMPSVPQCQQTKESSSDTVSITTPFDPGASIASAVEGLDSRTLKRRRIHQSP